MVSEFFTHDECLIIEMYLRKSRGEVIEDIENAMPYIEDPEMHKVCEKLLVKLNGMSDDSFNNMDFAINN